MSAAEAHKPPGIGLHRGVPSSAYHAWDAANFSTLRLFERSPAHAREQMIHPKDSTPAQELGTAMHAAILEPELFKSRYVCGIEVDKRTKKGKAEWAELEAKNAGKIILSPADYYICRDTTEAVWSHPAAQSLISGRGINEASIVWRDETTGTFCCCRPDRLTDLAGWPFVVNLKSTRSAARDDFRRDAARYHYDANAAFYLDGCNAVAPLERRHAIIAVEKERPFGVAVYEYGADELDLGRRTYRPWLDAYAASRRDNSWPCYHGEIQYLDVPKWRHAMAPEEV